MKTPQRITIALDGETSGLIERLKEGKKTSQSDIIRKAIQFYCENESFAEISLRKKLYFYIDMLPSGEHVILDVDHWLLFLNLVESSPEKELFWEKHREVAKSHAEQLRQNVHSIGDMLERLEACNFFKIVKNSEKDFTLVLSSEITKKFVRIFLEEFSSAAKFEVEIRENLAKLRVIDKT